MSKYVVGLDIGYGNLKVVHGESDREPKIVVAPTGAAPAASLPSNAYGQESDGVVRVCVRDQDYVACIPHDRLANHSRVLYEDYSNTDAYRALYYASLLSTKESIINVLVTGLPSDQAQDHALCRRIRSSMTGRHVVNRDGKVIAVNEVSVVPQPLGGYVDYMVANDHAEALREARTLVVDPGHYSVDWVLMHVDSIQPDGMGSSKFATSKLLEEASEMIHKDKNGRVSPETLEHALRRGRKTAMLHGNTLDFMPYIEAAGLKLLPAVTNEILNSLRTRRDSVDVVLITGGGAVFYESALRQTFPHSRVVVAPQSVTANARGFWYLGAD